MTSRRLAAVALAIVPWLIRPGWVQPDTKTDFTISPWAYLYRALFAWNDHAGLGELQNQAYGYLFPYGPFFAVLHTLGVPAWAAQRAWWSLLLIVAFLGAERLIRRLTGVGTAAALVGALTYAIAPRVIAVLANISVEAWPGAVAPWLVMAALPLLRADTTQRQRARSAAGGGLLVAALGGVNATASAVVLVLPFLALVTADQRARRARALLWWAVGVVLGSLWWIAPLFILGRYAYPFLDYIETARLTTAVTSVPNVLRGASHWIAYLLDSQQHPVWQGGWVEAQYVSAIVATSALAGVGLGGLVLRARQYGRDHVTRWALACLATGVLMMTLGYASVVGSPFASVVRDFLDGPGAALRNVHKADPLVRLPLALGVAVMVERVRAAERSSSRRRHLLLLAVLVPVVMAPTALWVGRVGSLEAYRSIGPGWRPAATAVDAAAERSGGSTLVLPAARSPEFTWGTTTDEPLSALASSPVVARAAAPLGHPGATRLLDTIDLLASSGSAQQTLAGTLARMGIARVVVRHDLSSAAGAESAATVEQTLADSPGLTRVGRWGPITLWQVDAGTVAVTSYPADGELAVVGGPESLLDVAPSDAQGTTVGPGATPDVVTDSLRWRSYNNGRPAQNAFSPTLAAGDSAPTRIGAKDLPPAGDPQQQPTRVVTGDATSVTTSSTAADPFAAAYVGPDAGWFSAFDGSDSTAWISDASPAAWLHVRLGHATVLGTVTVRLATSPVTSPPHEVTINGRRATITAGVATVRLTAPTDHLRIVLRASGAKDQVGIADITMEGATVGSAISVPQVLGPQSALILRRDPRSSPTRAGEDGPRWTREVAWSTTGRHQLTATLQTPVDTASASGCGAAGTVRIDASEVPLRAVSPTMAVPCGDGVDIAAGRHRIDVVSGPYAEITSVRIDPAVPAAKSVQSQRSVSSRRLAPGEYRIRVAGGAATVLALDQGANPGWRAAVGSTTLKKVTVDGWRQGFVLSASVRSSTVEVGFAPNSAHQVGLLAGLLAVLGLVVAAAVGTSTTGELVTAEPTSQAAPRVAAGVLAAFAAVAVAAACSGPFGVVAAVVALLLLPRRHATVAAVGLMTASGLALAVFGVVDRQSVGAISGQLLAIGALSVVVRELLAGAPSGAPEPRRASPTPTQDRN